MIIKRYIFRYNTFNIITYSIVNIKSYNIFTETIITTQLPLAPTPHFIQPNFQYHHILSWERQGPKLD